MKNQEGFNRGPFRATRRDLRDLVATPVAIWMDLNPARRTPAAYQQMVGIPVDLASAGFAVMVSQDDAGWLIEISRKVTEQHTLCLEGRAQSLAAAFFQIAQDADRILDDLQRKARRQWEAAQEQVAA